MINVVMDTSAVPGSNSFSLSNVLILLRRAVLNCFLNGINLSETEHVSVGPRKSHSQQQDGDGYTSRPMQRRVRGRSGSCNRWWTGLKEAAPRCCRTTRE